VQENGPALVFVLTRHSHTRHASAVAEWNELGEPKWAFSGELLVERALPRGIVRAGREIERDGADLIDREARILCASVLDSAD
jgi:hypothetical protein